MEKEIGYAISELKRDGDAWPGRSWYAYGLERLEKLVYPASTHLLPQR